MLAAAVVGIPFLERIDPPALWTASEDLNEYGYPVYFVEQASMSFRGAQRPAWYDESVVDAIEPASAPAASAERAPDIVLILNESYYFLDDYTDIAADVSYTEGWDELRNAVRGRAIVPGTGGGTNQAEYELLTSNSMHLLSAWAPFNMLDLSGANSAAHYLAELGYSTAAFHNAPPMNYNRGLAYPIIGFEKTAFAPDLTQDAYGARKRTDLTFYQDVFSYYQSLPDEGPRFLYLLTYQNHSGYEQNDPSYDTVQTGRDFGGMTDDVNEYLTYVKMSSDALYQLTDFFNSVDRPVLVCMLGDHAPYIYALLPAREGMTEEEKAITCCATPFFIWANDAIGPINTAEDVWVSAPDLVPMLLDMAGLPVSAYYQTLLDLSDEIPVRTSTGLYRTADGEYGHFDPEDSRCAPLLTYYSMEYNNLQKPAARRQILFDPPGMGE